MNERPRENALDREERIDGLGVADLDDDDLAFALDARLGAYEESGFSGHRRTGDLVRELIHRYESLVSDPNGKSPEVERTSFAIPGSALEAEAELRSAGRPGWVESMWADIQRLAAKVRHRGGSNG